MRGAEKQYVGACQGFKREWYSYEREGGVESETAWMEVRVERKGFASGFDITHYRDVLIETKGAWGLL